jgi:hypothetical protein
MFPEALPPRWGQESPRAEGRQERETEETAEGRLTKIATGCGTSRSGSRRGRCPFCTLAQYPRGGTWIRPVVAAALGFRIQGMAFVTKDRLHSVGSRRSRQDSMAFGKRRCAEV